MSSELKRILYVEDDEAIAEVAIMTLEAMGDFDVTHCDSGRNALETYAGVAPQLVLMDVMMPEMDGPETMARLHGTFGAECAPIIFMTAKAQTHEQADYLKRGALGVIVKPFDPMQLCQQIRDIWETRHAA